MSTSRASQFSTFATSDSVSLRKGENERETAREEERKGRDSESAELRGVKGAR